MTRRFFAPAALVAALTLSGCFGASSPQQAACPETAILDSASFVTKFRPGAGREERDVAVRGEMTAIKATCSQGRQGANVALSLTILGDRGVLERAGIAEIPYFVAIVDPAQRIVAKEVFAARLDFTPSRQQARLTEELEQVIPLTPGASAAGYSIIAGFQLTADELEFNRRRGR